MTKAQDDIPPYDYLLTYEQVIDPQMPAQLMTDPKIGHKQIRLQLSDALVQMWAPDAIFNLLCWQILARFQLPIMEKHIVPRTTINSKNLAKIYTKFHNELRAHFKDHPTERKDAIFNAINELYNFIVEELPEYVATFSVVDLCKILHEKPIKELRESIGVRTGMNTEVIEKKIAMANKKFLEYIGTAGALKNEALLPFQQTGTLNPMQTSQMYLMFGLRTDIDDTLVLRPVTECAMSGLRSIVSYAVESLAGTKPMFYNKVGVRCSQYMGRKQHIATSSLTTIHPGDCGTTLTVPFEVTETNYTSLVGKYHVVDNHLFAFQTAEEVVPFIGRIVYLRSPLTCKYRDGTCEICGGLLLENINPKIGIGLLSSTSIIERITQGILSSKHLIRTVSQTYEIPSPADRYFLRVQADKLTWQSQVIPKLATWSMGVSLKDFSAGSFSDTATLKKMADIRESAFSRLRSVVLRDNKNGKMKTLPLQIPSGACPFFTREMLLHIRDNFGNIEQDSNMVWIPLAGTESFPIMQTIVVNDNPMGFVNSVEQFLSKGIVSYRSCHAALRAFTELIFTKAGDINLLHIEIMLKAYMISLRNMDYRIPEVTDPENVSFGSTATVIRFRSIGQQLAYQNLKQHLMRPEPYLTPVGGSVFDPLLGIL